jgi:hypothetical protein
MPTISVFYGISIRMFFNDHAPPHFHALCGLRDDERGGRGMKWDVVDVRPEANWTLHVRFTDGLVGRVRFSPEFFTGVFEPVRDPAVFAQVFVDHGAVAWPGDLDLAPDAMYAGIQAHGEWVLAPVATMP